MGISARRPQLLNLIVTCYSAHLQLSRGEICVANFIPPTNGACLGISIYFQYLSITLLVTLYVTEYNYKLKQLLTIYQGVHITYFNLNPECDKLYSFVRMILAKLIPTIASNEV